MTQSNAPQQALEVLPTPQPLHEKLDALNHEAMEIEQGLKHLHRSLSADTDEPIHAEPPMPPDLISKVNVLTERMASIRRLQNDLSAYIGQPSDMPF